MAVGIYGGSFDPIHIGHLITTRAVLEKRGLEKIIFIPNHISPLKQDGNALADIHRLRMVELAIKSFSYFEVSDYEILKGDVSYSVDTINHFKNFYEDLELIIGFDNLVVFDKWKQPEVIFELAKVIVMTRHSDEPEIIKNRFFEKAIFINTPNIEIASTEIRNRVRNNLPIDFLVTPEVSEYIRNNNLYK